MHGHFSHFNLPHLKPYSISCNVLFRMKFTIPYMILKKKERKGKGKKDPCESDGL